jgi:hypothetical protein
MFGKPKKPEYTGKMLVNLEKARILSEIPEPDGKYILSNLSTHIDFKSSSKPSIRFDVHNFILVPAIIINYGADIKDISQDWTQVMSPISEINYQPIQKWWPKDIFRGFEKLEDKEELTITYDNQFVIKLEVHYAFTAEEKAYFTRIEPPQEVSNVPVLQEPVFENIVIEDTIEKQEETEDKEKPSSEEECITEDEIEYSVEDSTETSEPVNIEENESENYNRPRLSQPFTIPHNSLKNYAMAPKQYNKSPLADYVPGITLMALGVGIAAVSTFLLGLFGGGSGD